MSYGDMRINAQVQNYAVNGMDSKGFKNTKSTDELFTVDSGETKLRNTGNSIEISYNGKTETVEVSDEFLEFLEKILNEQDNETDTEKTESPGNINSDNIMDITAGNGDLSDYSGSDLFDIFDSYMDENGSVIQFGDNVDFFVNGQMLDPNGAHTLLIKLLAGASGEQVEGFFNSFAEKYGEGALESIGDLLMWSRYANVTGDELDAFLDTAREYSEYFPVSSAHTGFGDYRSGALWL